MKKRYRSVIAAVTAGIMIGVSGEMTVKANSIDINEMNIRGKVSERTLENIALNKKATQSSIYTGSGWPAEANRAVDGNRSGNWMDQSVAATATNENNPWWQVDLGKNYPIELIKLFTWNNNGESPRLTPCTISIIDNQENVVWEKSFEEINDTKEIRVMGKNGEPVVGQYVKIVRNVGGQYDYGQIVIAECEVYTSVEQPMIKPIYPKTRSIIQRSNNNLGKIPVEGVYEGESEEIRARAVIEEGVNKGKATEWIVLKKEGKQFSGQIEAPAGGWYTIEIETDKKDEKIQIEKIGVGEVFITSGQSNAMNFGEARIEARNDTVSVLDPTTKAWVECRDPQPALSGNNGIGGSPWPVVGDYLTERLGIPIGFVSTGWGGSEINNFMPGNSYYYRLKDAIDSLEKTGFRAILWHQGESDALAGTSSEVYKERLLKIINQTREDAGFEIPWFIANAAYHTQANEFNQEQVLEGQRKTCNEKDIFLGPLTDDMLEGYRAQDGVHFNETGLIEHGTRWGDVLLGKYFEETILTEIKGPNEVESQEEFEVIVDIEDVKQVYAQDITIKYDTNIFELKGITGNGLTQKINMQETEDGNIRILAFTEGGVTGKEEILSIKFKAKDLKNTEVGEISIVNGEFGSVLDGQANVKKSEKTKKQIIVKEKSAFEKEDITMDGRVDVADIALVAYYYKTQAGEEEWEEAQKVDINRDGKIDILDLSKIADKMLEKK